jgi:hypothetical protein
MASYGTVMRAKTKPGQRDAYIAHMKSFQDNPPQGFQHTYSGKVDGDPDGVVGIVVFESREAYRKNADSPEMHERYKEYMAFLQGDPTWTDVEWVD